MSEKINLNLIASVLEESTQQILCEPENYISREFCDQLLSDIPLEFPDKLQTLDEDTLFETNQRISAVEVNKSSFKLKAQLIKSKLINERKSLTLGYGGMLRLNECDHSDSKNAIHPKSDTGSDDEEDDEELTSILTMETGLDRGLVPAKILALKEYKGIILHLVQWTDANEEMEAIPSPILSARYPQIVIKFYESLALMFDLTTGETQKIRF